MESAALLEMLEFIKTRYSANVVVVLTDDDSTMRAVTQWSNEDYVSYYNVVENQHTLLCVDYSSADYSKNNQGQEVTKGVPAKVAGTVVGRITKVADTVYERDENGDILYEEYGDKKYKIVLATAKYKPSETGEVAVLQHTSRILVNGRPIIGYNIVKDGKLKPITRTNKGRLPLFVVEPKFAGDPAHRKKTLKNDLYKLLAKPVKDRHDCAEGDVTRVSINFIYMVRQLHEYPQEQWVNRAKAVLEHHFDNHEYCGRHCHRKDKTAEERAKSPKMYRCKEKNASLYEALNGIILRFITLDRLLEVGHGGDTNVNESLNNTISHFAPKNRTYSGTVSLQSRILMAIGIHLVGYDVYFEQLFLSMGIEPEAGTLYHLSSVQKMRKKKLDTSRTK